MHTRKLLDAFFNGVSANGSDGEYRVEAYNSNPLTKHFEACSLLFSERFPANVLQPALAAYVPEREVILLNMEHPEAVEVAQFLLTTDLFNTGETDEKVRLYCPLACEDCEMSLRCSVFSETTRCLRACPRALPDTGPVVF